MAVPMTSATVYRRMSWGMSTFQGTPVVAWGGTNAGGRAAFVAKFTAELPETGADFDDDGDVDGADFLAWQQGEVSNPPSQSDLDTWQASFGTSSTLTTTASIPEASSLLLGALAAVGVLVWRRRID